MIEKFDHCLRFQVLDKKISFLESDAPEIVADNRGNICIHVDFDEQWDGVAKVARFIFEGSWKDCLLDADNECYCPSEVVKKGRISFGIYGADLKTTTPITISVIPSILSESGEELPDDPTPGMYEQILEQYQVAFEHADEATQAAWDAIEAAEAASQTLLDAKTELENGGFITGLKEMNKGYISKVWIGTQAEYDEIEEKLDNCFYLISDDPTGDNIKKTLEAHGLSLDALTKKVEEIEDSIPEEGAFAEIIAVPMVEGDIGGVSCTHQETGESMKYEMRGGSYVYKVAKYGTYSLVWAREGQVAQGTSVLVDEIKQYNVVFMPYKENFADNDWETIVNACKLGNVPATWKVGDYKQIDYGNGKRFVYIIGKYHDVYSDTGDIAPLTFMLEKANTNDPMHNTTTLDGGWAFCSMRTQTLALDLGKLPLKVSEGIREVDKETYLSLTRAAVLPEKLFLLSETEFLGRYASSSGLEGKQYDFWKNGNELPNEQDTWTRSLYTSTSFVYRVYDSDYEIASYNNKPAMDKATYSFAFCF